MAIKFHAPTPWPQIQKHAASVKAYVAVPFIGKNAARYLPIVDGSVLVTRFNKAAVKSGQVDPTEIIKFLKRGVRVHNYDTLHAKVYVFGRRAFVGSANVSLSSQRLAEACVEVTDASTVADARAFVESLCGDLVTLEYAKSLIDFYPAGGERFYGAAGIGGTKTKAAARSKVWIVPVSYSGWPEDIKEADITGKKTALEKVSDSKLNKLSPTYWYKHLKIEPGDWVVWRSAKGKGFEYEPPGRVVHIENVRGSQQVIIYAELPKRSKDLTSSAIRKLLPEAVDATMFEGFNPRLIVSADKAADFLKLWPEFKG